MLIRCRCLANVEVCYDTNQKRKKNACFKDRDPIVCQCGIADYIFFSSYLLIDYFVDSGNEGWVSCLPKVAAVQTKAMGILFCAGIFLALDPHCCCHRNETWHVPILTSSFFVPLIIFPNVHPKITSHCSLIYNSLLV